MIEFLTFITVLICLYAWTDFVLRNYFYQKRQHHLKLIRDIGKEKHKCQD